MQQDHHAKPQKRNFFRSRTSSHPQFQNLTTAVECSALVLL